ncbi:pyruvate, phosphate dikinase [Lutibacter sp. B2]|nr:pyruvate, phosphate dikinase [Lutibacter sp. B2]
MTKYIYSFNEGSKEMKNLLGGKGANLGEMTKIGLPVPQGFTVSTEACNQYYEDGQKINKNIIDEVFEYLHILEKQIDKKFGDINNPLLVSVRSGSVVSMPGMMDTILNLGLNDQAVEGLAKQTENGRFAYDSYRRFIQMFGDVVLDIPKYKFDNVLDQEKEKNSIQLDTELTVENLKSIINEYKKLVKKETHKDFPQKPEEQLLMAIDAVFGSWNNTRAIVYRELNDIPGHLGTAVNIQSMVFGNMGETSGTGVAFTRDPSTGEKKLFGEFLMNAQGEDVVAGIRTPQPIAALKDTMSDVYEQFVNIAERLENHYKDMQDIEFTIEKGKLFFLQTRNGKRTAKAAINVAVDMVNEGIISKEEAILRIEPTQLDQLLHPTFKPEALENSEKITQGLPASPGAATGKVYFNAEDVVKAKEAGEKAILVRLETSPEDIEGMVSAEGILTARGGMTSHAAVVARGMGRCCVAGCGEVRVDEANKTFKVGNKIFKEGDWISLNGNTGAVYVGSVATQEAELTGNFGQLMEWADKFRTLKIRTNADTPRDAAVAMKFGVEGIGLCRTEHMFFDEERIIAVRQMIVSKNIKDRKVALDKLLPFQKNDFVGIYETMGELPVTVRLLDPPLHEFLPHNDEDIKVLSTQIGVEYNTLKETVEDLKEFNPMLGHRGCRLGITYPEIYEMQVKAIILAAIEVKTTKKLDIKPEIMVPLIGSEKELEIIKELIIKTVDALVKESGVEIEYQVGTMIEVPRAALTADAIAKHAEFFSFGTNDLTQMTYGFSRDDSGKFIGEYRKKEIFEKDPFQRLDQVGVGRLMEMAVDLGKKTRKDIKLGICGEHGGDPESIAFCHKLGLDYVSCSPYRVPVARMAAARAALQK